MGHIQEVNINKLIQFKVLSKIQNPMNTAKRPHIVLSSFLPEICNLKCQETSTLSTGKDIENSPDQKWWINISQGDPFIIVGACTWEEPV